MNILKGPWRITFDTNPDLCNLHCIMCEEHSPYNKKKRKQNRLMDYKIIENVINNASIYGLKEIIPSTMGEPLLYPKIKEFINLIAKYNLKINLTTNGTFPILGAKEWSEILLPYISDMKISINGTTKYTNELIMKNSNFEKLLSNIETVINVRDRIITEGINKPTITLQITFMKTNVDELSDIIKMAIDLNINRVKGHHLWMTWPELVDELLTNETLSRRKWNKTVKHLMNIIDKYRLINGKKIQLDNFYPINNDNGKTKLPYNWICPFLGREAWIAWDGTFNVCCAPEKERRKLGNFGNVKETNFIDLWRSDKYKFLVKNWGDYSICKNCNMRKPKSNIVRICEGDDNI